MSETSDIVAPALKALKAIRVKAWRMNAGGRRGRVTLAPSGTPDILGYLSPNGRLFGLEAKVAGKEPTDVQQAWHDDARDSGVLVAVINSAQEAVRVVQEWQRQERASYGLTMAHSSVLESGQTNIAGPAFTSVVKAMSPAPTATSGTSAKRFGKRAVGR